MRPERYDPRARSVGGPWRMVKCKDGAYVCFEQHKEIVADYAKKRVHDINQIGGLKQENRHLKKAGDAMYRFITDFIVENRISSHRLNKLQDNWDNAMNGGAK